MTNIVDAILKRIEKSGYRISIVGSARTLSMEASLPGGGRFIVHAGPNMHFAAARELADMIGVEYGDILSSFRRLPWPREPEYDDNLWFTGAEDIGF